MPETETGLVQELDATGAQAVRTARRFLHRYRKTLISAAVLLLIGFLSQHPEYPISGPLIQALKSLAGLP